MILDTNALSAFADGDTALAALVSGADRLALSPIVLGEYRFGIAASRFRARYEAWLERIEAEAEILPMTNATSRHYAQVRRELRMAGTPIPWHDIWIAAQCREHRLPVTSQDAHFDQVEGIRRLSW